VNQSRTRARGGFTLIELAFVIAIIALIAALLLPGLARSRNNALKIQCISNLHQMGLALNAYAGDNRAYPMGTLWWVTLEHQGFGINSPPTNYLTKGVWLCPAATFKPLHNGAKWAVRMSYGYNTFGVLRIGDRLKSMGLNGHQDPRTFAVTPILESEVVAPAEMMAIGDSFSSNLHFMRTPSDELAKKGNTLSRHSGRGNVLLCDGHVDSPALHFLFDETSAPALSRWNRDHEPHMDLLSTP
jgi:prepilin-type processing-associated H-X9-DG protein/prepilin-type N-terminal cleavage/methylation domain-containing protein